MFITDSVNKLIADSVNKHVAFFYRYFLYSNETTYRIDSFCPKRVSLVILLKPCPYLFL